MQIPKISFQFTIIFFLFLLSRISNPNLCYAQNNNVGIGTLTPAPSALLDIDGSGSNNNKGILIPRMTSAQRIAISSPANSLLVFDTDLACFYYWDAIIPGWKSLGNTGTGINGTTGETGATGGIGSTGNTGSTGFIGGTGSIGNTGSTGSSGVTGSNGYTGSTGGTGAIGSTGFTGSTGADGALNAWSLTGNAGTNGGTNFIGTTDNISLRFRTNNTQKMIVDSVGNVGIGTTSPATVLHISKNGGGYTNRGITLEQTDAGSEIGVEFRNGIAGGGVAAALTLTQGGTEGMVLTTFSSLPSGKRDINFKPGDATSVTFKEGGNVGIGTTTPGTSLEVKGAVTYTPSITNLGTSATITPGNNGYIKLNPSVACTITSFVTTGAVTGQRVIIENASTLYSVTITDSGGVKMNGSVNFVMGYQDTLSLIFDGIDWIEIGRSDN